MFSDKSRYKKAATTTVTNAGGQTVTAVKLRKLPALKGYGVGVKKQDRLDLMAQRNYQDDTKFWHIADANTKLDARDLEEANITILVPKQ